MGVLATPEGKTLLKRAKASHKNEEGKPWSFCDIAAKAGVVEKTVSRFFAGKQPISEYSAISICEALGLKYDDVVQVTDISGPNWTNSVTPPQSEIAKLLSILKKLNQQERSHLQSAYEDCCQTYCPAGFDRPFILKIESLVDSLQGISQGESSITPIVYFVAVLVKKLPRQAPSYQELETWGRTQTSEFTQIRAQIQKQPVKNPEVYLMMRVQARQQKPGYYSVTAALVNDPAPLQHDAKTTYQTVLCGEDHLPEELPALLQNIILGISDSPTSQVARRNLTVKWFLPQELMESDKMDVDQWQVRFEDGEKPLPIGTQCQVVIRSLERDLPSYSVLKKNDLKNFWLKLSPNQECYCGDVLAYGNGDLRQLCKDMARDHFLGCRFVLPADPGQRKFVFEELINSALSIAVWIRRTFEEQNVETAIQPILEKYIGELPVALKAMRNDARIDSQSGQSDTVCISTHLSLLWDNPFRSFPPIDYES